jgi:hypothetical protein
MRSTHHQPGERQGPAPGALNGGSPAPATVLPKHVRPLQALHGYPLYNAWPWLTSMPDSGETVLRI